MRIILRSKLQFFFRKIPNNWVLLRQINQDLSLNGEIQLREFLRDWKKNINFFSNSIDSNYIPIFHRLLRIFGALENKFGLILSKDEDDFPLEYFRTQLKKENSLIKYLKDEQWEKKNFIEIRELFPEFEPKDIIEFSCGSYGLHLSKSYIVHSEKIDYFQSMRNKNLFKIKGLLSRFTTENNPRRYMVLLRLDKFSKPLEIESYCSCKSGARTIGGCCHSSSILARVTLRKYDENIEEIRKRKRKKFQNIINIKKRKKKWKINLFHLFEKIKFFFFEISFFQIWVKKPIFPSLGEIILYEFQL